jgi:hypothetical protein
MDAIVDNSRKVKEALDVWAEWMQRNTEKLGYPSKSILCSNGSTTFEDMIDVLEDSISEAIDAILDGCTISQRLAVHHFHLAAVWHSNRTTIEDDYADALIKIEIGLRKRGLI